MDNEKLGMKVVVVGNPIDGLTIYGPFNNGDEAVEWIEKQKRISRFVLDWWIASLDAVQ